MRLFAILLIALPALPLSAVAVADAAHQQTAIPTFAPATTLRQADARVAAAAYRLSAYGRSQCSETFPLTGLLLHHLAEYEPADRPLMISLYGLDRGPGILTVLEGSPAAAAGLVAGDVLLAANGSAFPPPGAIAAEPKTRQRRKLIQATEAQLEQSLRAAPAQLRVLRQGQALDLLLDSIPGCLGRVRLARSNQVNAFADGNYVTMTTGMLDFVRNEDELALILAHELSHNILRHPAILDEQGVPKGGWLRGIGKNASLVWKTEEEADRLAIRLMWYAGYDVTAAIPFWKRLYAKFDVLPQIFRTHPSLGARERIVREAIAALPAMAPAPPNQDPG